MRTYHVEVFDRRNSARETMHEIAALLNMPAESLEQDTSRRFAGTIQITIVADQERIERILKLKGVQSVKV